MGLDNHCHQTCWSCDTVFSADHQPHLPLSPVTKTVHAAQDLDKKDAAADKQRESMMVGLTKTKTELGSLQDALARTQLDLDKTSFELHAKTSMQPWIL